MAGETVIAQNAMLNAVVFGQMSLHSAFPGATGASEISGGSPAYARKNITVAAASGGSRAVSGSVTFDVSGVTVRWVGTWNASGQFVWAAPNGASPKRFHVNVSASTIESPGHAYIDTQTITFYGGPAPLGLTEGVTYFVRDATANNFKVAATSGGVAITITGQADEDCVVSRITERVYSSQDTHSIGTSSFTF